jgi:hypothetical protein
VAVILIERSSRWSVDEAWRRITDWERHAEHIPLTRIIVTTAGPTRVGTRFVARTGAGRAGFDDPMEVVRWEPPAGAGPGRCRLEKRGATVTGWAEIEVAPHDEGSRIVWREELRVDRLPRLADPLTLWAGRRLFGRAVAGLLAG